MNATKLSMMAVQGLMVLGVVSCGTTGSASWPTANSAILDADPGRDHRSRMKRSKIVAINGVSGAGKEAHVAAGLTTATVRYNWPQGGAQEVNLKFRAKGDRRYFVKYAAFPPNVDKLRGTTAVSTTAQGIGDASWRVMEGARDPVTGYVGAAILAPAIVLGTVDYFSRIGLDIADKRKAAQWVDMMVISEKEAEGVVRFVRVFPSGKVEWKPWDACSNAPGNPQSGRAIGHPAERSAAQGDGTFSRQQSFVE